MITSVIKYFNSKKGFGFIAGAGEDDDYYIHISDTVDKKPLEKGDRVMFETRPSKRKPGTKEAYDLVLSGAAAAAGRRPAGGGKPQKGSHKAVGNAGNRGQKVDSGGSRPGPAKRLTSPYCFKRRPVFERQTPERRHEKLNEDCCDIAFEVEWRALTPVAANPCSDKSDGDCCPLNNEGHYQGYDKRWLTVDGRLALSPFTVKSAVANGFAALLGGCYRVETAVVEHHADPATFQCTGAWRRYRVAMNNSHPGLLESIDYETGEIAVIPVEELYYDEKCPPGGVVLREGETYNVNYEIRDKKNKKINNNNNDRKDVKKIITGFGGGTAVVYYGPYRFGMDLSFGPGEFNKNHYHRFYKKTDVKLVRGRISTLNLKSIEDQKKKVYMGVFKKFNLTAGHDDRTGFDGEPWHQDLGPDNPDFQPGRWVYFQQFENEKGEKRVAAVGLNFQFKTAFHLHDDAVPPGQQTCVDMNLLCPRCALFGMVDETGASREAAGLRGRFKAAALVGPPVAMGEPVTETVAGKTVYLRRWVGAADEKGKQQELAGQFLLPIQGQAKANKRDTAAYYDRKTGLIAGAKEYLHADLKYADLPSEIERRTRKSGSDYSHTLRNYAVVCRENLTFTGTLGAENCTPDEIAALLLVLEHDLSGHGFKVGLAKAMGLGSMVSTVKQVWLKRKADTAWECICPRAGLDLGRLKGKSKQKSFNLAELQSVTRQDNSWPVLLEDKIPGLSKCLKDLETARRALNLVEGRSGRRLGYPEPGYKYWENFQQKSVGQ